MFINYIKYLFNEKSPYYNWFEVLWCRIKGHPKGVWWYSNKLEPDMHCKGCGDDLG